MQIAHIIKLFGCATRGLVLALVVASLGCGTGRRARNADDGPVRTTIEVQNEDFNDMTIYVLSSGARTRLGIAPGNKTTVLTIPEYLIQGVSFMRFVANPLAGNHTPVTEEIDVNPGDQLVMIILPGG